MRFVWSGNSDEEKAGNLIKRKFNDLDHLQE